MAVIVLDQARLSGQLQPLPRHKRGAFAASCAQRLAGCFLDSPLIRRERPDDFRLVKNTLEELWAAARHDTPERVDDLTFALEQLPELLADVQWRGRGAYQTHALAALVYAAESWDDTSPESAVECAQHVFDTAAFLDRRLDPSPIESLDAIHAFIDHGAPMPDPATGPFQTRELQRQQEDLAMITRAVPEAWGTTLSEIRRNSEAYAEAFQEALDSTFS